MEEEVKQQAPREQDPIIRELEQLRAAERRRAKLKEAQEALKSRGIDPRFGAFVLGEDDDQTAKRIEVFDMEITRVLREQAEKFTAGEPRDFSVTETKKRTRGIRRV